MDKRKVGSEGGYSAHTTPIPTKLPRPSSQNSPAISSFLNQSTTTEISEASTPVVASSLRISSSLLTSSSNTTGNGALSSYRPSAIPRANGTKSKDGDTPLEMEKLLSKYTKMIETRRSEVTELKKVNSLRTAGVGGENGEENIRLNQSQAYDEEFSIGSTYHYPALHEPISAESSFNQSLIEPEEKDDSLIHTPPTTPLVSVLCILSSNSPSCFDFLSPI